MRLEDDHELYVNASNLVINLETLRNVTLKHRISSSNSVVIWAVRYE